MRPLRIVPRHQATPRPAFRQRRWPLYRRPFRSRPPLRSLAAPTDVDKKPSRALLPAAALLAERRARPSCGFVLAWGVCAHEKKGVRS